MVDSVSACTSTGSRFEPQPEMKMKLSNRYRGVLALVSMIVMFVGCSALGGRDEEPVPQRRGPTAIEIPLPVPQELVEVSKDYPSNCTTDHCREAWDRMRDRLSPGALVPGDSVVSSSRGDGCKTDRPKIVVAIKKKVVKPLCGSTTAATPAPVASTASLPPDIATFASTPTFKLADPLTERHISRVGSYDSMWDSFGYTNGQLVYRPSFGANKSVFMTEQVADLTKFECPRMKIAGTTEQLAIQLRAAFKPSLLWESDYHRLVAIYGGADNKNIVRDIDVRNGVESYLLQHVEALCQFRSQ